MWEHVLKSDQMSYFGESSQAKDVEGEVGGEPKINIPALYGQQSCLLLHHRLLPSNLHLQQNYRSPIHPILVSQ